MQCSGDVHEANGLGILRPELPDPASVPWRYLGVRSTFEETLSRLEIVLSHLSTLNLKVKPEKCQLFYKKVHYLRYVVTCEGTSLDCEKLRAVSEWPRPETLRNLRGFLGLSGYYWRFLKGYAEFASLLQHLLQSKGAGKKGKKVMRGANPKGDGCIRDKWDSSCETTFLNLKQMLTDATVLEFPDFSHGFVLETDTSFSCLGAVLSQWQENRLVVLWYASRALKPCKRNIQNYFSMKLELLALY